MAALSISMFEIEFLIEHGQVYFEHYNIISFFASDLDALFHKRRLWKNENSPNQPCVSQTKKKKDRFHCSIDLYRWSDFLMTDVVKHNDLTWSDENL